MANAKVNFPAVSVVPVADDGRDPVRALQLDGDVGEPKRQRKDRAAAVHRLHVPDGGVRTGDVDDDRCRAHGVLSTVIRADGAIGKRLT